MNDKNSHKRVVEIDADIGGSHDLVHDIGWRLTIVIIFLALIVYGMFGEYLSFSSSFVESYW